MIQLGLAKNGCNIRRNHRLLSTGNHLSSCPVIVDLCALSFLTRGVQVGKADKAVRKFKLYDGDEVIGIIKIPVSELTEEKQMKPMTMEPYKKNQAPPSGEILLSAYVNTYKNGTRRKSVTLGHKVKLKLGSSAMLDVAERSDAISAYSGESMNSTSKMSKMKKKILGKKEGGLRGANCAN